MYRSPDSKRKCRFRRPAVTHRSSFSGQSPSDGVHPCAPFSNEQGLRGGRHDMSGMIFISYRRGDDPGSTGRLFERLQVEGFSSDQILMDIDSIASGNVISQCIGGRSLSWGDRKGLAHAVTHGARRLDNPDDFVRVAIHPRSRRTSASSGVDAGRGDAARGTSFRPASRPRPRQRHMGAPALRLERRPRQRSVTPSRGRGGAGGTGRGATPRK